LRTDGRDGAQFGLIDLAAQVGNRGFAQVTKQGGASLQRWGAAAGLAMPPSTIPAPAGPYRVGANVYQENQYSVAIDQVADFWTAGNGIVAKQKQAVQHFCGSGGAGAKAEPDLAEAIFEAVVLAVIAFATDGVGTVVAAAAEKGVARLAASLANRAAIEKAAKTVVDKAVDLGKDKGKELAKGLFGTPKVAVTGGRQLATPLASYQTVLEDSIDATCGEEKAQTLQRLLDLQSDPDPQTKWIAAAAIYDALQGVLATADELTWNSTSDGWFRMQQASGRGTFAATDIGQVLVDLKKDYYPTDGAPGIAGAYLYGEGVNEATLKPYAERPLSEIKMAKVVVMDNGSMGWGWVECGWKMRIDVDNKLIGMPRALNRYGYPWLAAKALNKKDIDTDDDRITADNVTAGAQKVWDEIKDKKSEFKAASATSGPSAY
jgi:hypothetical protein